MKKSMNSITVALVQWQEKEADIGYVRKTVFVQEQNVPLEIEMDEQDPQCQHVLAYDQNNRPIGTGRLDPKGKVGRMAVLPHYRGMGTGRRILETLIQYGRDKGLQRFYLSAQLHAVSFYEQYGFTRYGEEFEEAGIMHVMMKME
jgi:predicted GNAT family N-acyltransferase